MNKIFVSAILISLIASCGTNKNFTVKKLSQASNTWDGGNIIYPKAKEQITSIHITIAPKKKIPFHCHPVPTIGYIISGKIEVEKMNGEKKLFNAGDAVMEVVNTWHRGYNPSLTKDAKIVVFYIGQESVGNTIYYNAKNKEKCHL